MRKTYEVTPEQIENEEGGRCAMPEVPTVLAPQLTELLLFTTPTCPNCKMAKTFLDRSGIKYQIVDVSTNKDLANSYQIKQAPTLIVPTGDSYKVYENASLIRGYIAEQGKNNN